MYLLDKDHKSRKEGQKLPATRPVVSGYRGMGLSLSNIVSDIVENIANVRDNPLEVISTEDLLSRVRAHNEAVKDVKDERSGCRFRKDCQRSHNEDCQRI